MVAVKIWFPLTAAACVILFGGPPVIFFTYRLHQCRCCVVVRKRNYPAMLMNNIICMFGMLIISPLMAIGGCGLWGERTRFVIIICHQVLLRFCSHAWSLCALYRFYTLMYETRLVSFVKQDEWKAILNPAYKTRKETLDVWFYNHSSTYGNRRLVCRALFCAYIFVGLVSISHLSVFLYDPSNYDPWHPMVLLLFWTNAFFYIMPFILCIVIYHYTPKLEDHLFIRGELRRYIWTFLIWNVVFSSLNTLIWLSGEEGDVVWGVFDAVSTALFMGLIQLATTGYVCEKLNRCKHLLCNNPKHASMVRLSCNPCRDRSIGMMDVRIALHNIVPSQETDDKAPNSPSPSPSPIPTPMSLSPMSSLRVPRRSRKKRSSAQFTPLKDALATNRGYVAFMHHLNKEYSTENLLAFTEILHYKWLFRYILQDMSKYERKWDMAIKSDGLVIPYSGIICDALEVKSFKEISKHTESVTICSAYNIGIEMFEKYVRSATAVHEINVSSRTRRDITFFFSDPTAETHIVEAFQNGNNRIGEHQFDEILYTLFDRCLVEIRSVMMDSFTRFARTEEFQKLSESIQNG